MWWASSCQRGPQGAQEPAWSWQGKSHSPGCNLSQLCALLHCGEEVQAKEGQHNLDVTILSTSFTASSMHTHARAKQAKVPEAAHTFGWWSNNCLQLAAQGLPAGF